MTKCIPQINEQCVTKVHCELENGITYITFNQYFPTFSRINLIEMCEGMLIMMLA